MSGVKGMVITGRLVEPPPSARKVPSFKLWMEEDGTPHGPYGPKKLKPNSRFNAPTIYARDDAGREFTVSVAQMVARAWLPPKPEGSKLVHLNGDLRDNRASNLAWVPNMTNGEKCRAYKDRNLPKLQADPNDPRHGTRTGYAIGCRCTRCRNAAMVYGRMLETRKTIKEVEGCANRQGQAR